jgi:hypothetical protein
MCVWPSLAYRGGCSAGGEACRSRWAIRAAATTKLLVARSPRYSFRNIGGYQYPNLLSVVACRGSELVVLSLADGTRSHATTMTPPPTGCLESLKPYKIQSALQRSVDVVACRVLLAVGAGCQSLTPARTKAA